MRILLDECVPRPLQRVLPKHDVRTVAEMGWTGKRNGELISLIASNRFDIFLTVDQNLRYQQHLRGAGIAIVVLVAPSNRLADLVPLMDRLRNALNTIKSGNLVEIHT